MEPVLRHDIGRGIERGEGRGVYLGRIERLADIFQEVSPRSYGDPIEEIERFAPFSRSDGPGAVLQGFATVELRQPGGLHLAVNVLPTEAVRRVVRENMVHPGQDHITFKIIEWESGDALVTAENSQIIGGAWIAFLTPEAVAELRAAMNR